jgi:hypothetical protein
MIKRITKIDVQPMCDEIDNNLWLPTGGMVGHGRNWVGSEIQTLIRHKTLYQAGGMECDPCDFETPLDDLCLPDYCPTNTLFMYPEAIDTLVWFATTYGGKYARAMYYRTPPNTSVDIHIDAQPDQFNLQNKHHAHKHDFYYKKDRYHVVIDGSYDYTVDYELEDKIYEFPITMTSPVTETFSKGEVWWFNNKRPHKSYNNGNIPKINLVFDIEGTNV